MKHPLIQCAWLLVMLMAPSAWAWQAKPAGEPPAPVHAPMRVLIVGDELTDAQSMPHILLRLAQAGKEPRRAYVEHLGGAGSTLEGFVEGSSFWGAIRSQRWDVVVLQDDEKMAGKYKATMLKAARGLAKEIRLRRAKPLLLVAPGVQGDKDMQAAIEKNCAEVAGELDLTLVPVGQAWREAETADDKLVLYQKDKRQPTAAGAYLTACVLYAVIYDKSPDGLPADAVQGISAEDAKKLQSAAWKSVQAAKAAPPVKPKESAGKKPAK